MKLRKIEVCCTSVDDVMEAYYGGAIRVELCSAISCGGVTPSHGLIMEAVAAAAPKASMTCPYCGAVVVPDERGCCEFCGSVIQA